MIIENSNNELILPKFNINDRVFYSSNAALCGNKEIVIPVKVPCVVSATEVISTYKNKQQVVYKLGLLTPNSADVMKTFGVIDEEYLEKMSEEEFNNLFK